MHTCIVQKSKYYYFNLNFWGCFLQSLNESNDSLRKMQSFQGGVPEVYKEECPLAGILSAVYVVRIVDQLQLCSVVLAFYVNH